MAGLGQTQVDFSSAPAPMPVGQTFSLPPLYRVGGNGKIWAWAISFDGKDLVMCWETLDNFKQGLIQSTTRPVEMNTRSVSLYEQALLEARHEHKNKRDKQGYGEQLIQHDIFSLPAMLCTTWDPAKNQIRRWPVWVMAKLDGCRCRAHVLPESSDVHLMSRATQVINNLRHIREEFARFNQFAMQVITERFPTISPLCRADGELYTHDLDFDQISGITRLVNSASPVEGLVKYYMFDLMMTADVPYDQRYLILVEAFQRHTQLQGCLRYLHVLGASIASTKEDIVQAHNEFVNQGYEGVIIRKVGGTTAAQQAESYYKGTRCTAIYKYKQFQDDEGYIIGAEASNGGHEDGGVIWSVQDRHGRQFMVRPRGNVDRRKQIYQEFLTNPNQFIGQKYRYRFQDLTPEGKPRFPVGIGFVYDR